MTPTAGCRLPVPSSRGAGGREPLCSGQQKSHEESLFSCLEHGRCSGGSSPALLPQHRAWLPGTVVQHQVGTAAGQAAVVLRGRLRPPRHRPIAPPRLLLAEEPSPAGAAGPRRVHAGGALEGSGDAVLFPRGAGTGTGLGSSALLSSGGERGPDPAAAGAAARHGDPWHGFRARRRRANCASVCSPGSRRADVLKTPGTQ